MKRDLLLVLDLRLSVAADDEKSEAGERSGEEDKGEEELSAQAQVGWHVS